MINACWNSLLKVKPEINAFHEMVTLCLISLKMLMEDCMELKVAYIVMKLLATIVSEMKFDFMDNAWMV